MAVSQPSSSVREPLKHIAALDGVRGVAILSVLLYHFLWANSYSPSLFLRVLLNLRAAGWVGVDIFFALSGFLITGILYDTLQDPHFFRNFYLRRVLRIFPLYYAVVIVICVWLHPRDTQQRLQLVALLAYLQNTSLYWNTGATFVKALTGHLWSLAVEEQFYFVWPLLVFLLRDRRVLLWAACIISALSFLCRYLLLAHGADTGAVYHLTYCRADSLLSGAWLALMVRGPWRERVLGIAPAVFWTALVFCGVLAFRTGSFDWATNREVTLYGFSLLAVLGTSMIGWSLNPASICAVVMRSPFLRFFGRYSYGMYVYHLIVSSLLNLMLTPALVHHIHSAALIRFIQVPISFTLTIFLAWLSFHQFEARFLRLKRFFNPEAASSRSLAASIRQ